jgi:crotonobetainyl-CoA:carnitine CoA-transferase CaiB-like acyl-CoA transferase
LEFPKNPVHYSKSELSELKEPPLLGEHTDEILRDILGYSRDRIEGLRGMKVIE